MSTELKEKSCDQHKISEQLPTSTICFGEIQQDCLPTHMCHCPRILVTISSVGFIIRDVNVIVCLQPSQFTTVTLFGPHEKLVTLWRSCLNETEA